MRLLKSLKKFGLRRGSEKWLQERSPACDHYIEQKRYRSCLKNGKPYFGTYLAACQGNPLRHYFMQKLVELECRSRENEPFDILEVGSWAGGSAVSWAEALKKYANGNGNILCVDPWIRYFDLSVNSANVYKTMETALDKDDIFPLFIHNIRTSGHNDVVRVFRGTFEEAFSYLRTNRFQLAFVDGSHHYEDVLNDLKRAVNLVCDGGVICGDDLELQFHEVDRDCAVANSSRDYIEEPKTGLKYHPGVTVAVGELFGQVSSWHGFWAMRKQHGSWVKIQSPELDSQPDIIIPKHLIQ